MNVALPALIVFLVLLPGFIFRARFKRAERTSLDFSPFGQVVAGAVMTAAVAHLIWLAIGYTVFGRRFEPIVLMQLLSAAPASQAEAAAAVAREFNWVASYFITLLFVCATVPVLLRGAIIRRRLDRASSPLRPVLRFHDAPWYYLLTGADFEACGAPDFVVIAAIVEVGKEAVLYTGVLDNFYFDPEGQLDRLVLQGVSRRPMDRDKNLQSGERPPAERFYPIEGDAFVLRYSEIVTLNVQYVHLAPPGN